MNESYAVDKWLYATLHGDSTLLAAAPGGIHADAAPMGTTGVYVTYAMMANADLLTLSGVRMFNKNLYIVKAVGAGQSYGVVQTAAERIDALLKRTAGSVTGGLILSCVREEIVRYSELVEQRQFRHLGGLYRIQAQEA